MSAVREILAHFGVDFDTHKLKKGENQIEATIGQLKHLGHAVAGVFAFHQIESFVQSTVEAAQQIEKTSRMIGLSATDLQSWQHAANMADVEAETLTTGLRFLSRNAVEASKGSADISAVFDRLGVSFKDANGSVRPVTEMLPEISDGFKAIENPADRVQLAMALFGRQGLSMMPMLLEGSERLAEYREQVEELGGGFSELGFEAAEKLEKHEKQLALLSRGIRNQLMVLATPALLSWGHALESAGKWLMRANKNGELLRATMLAFGAYALTKLPEVVAALKHINWQTTMLVAKFAIMFLVLDDLVAWFRGGKSLIGEFFGAFAPGVNEAAAEIGQFVSWATKSWDNLGQALMMVPTMVGMAVTMAVNEIVHGVGWAIAWVFDQWDKLIRKLQLPGWATKLLGTDQVGDQSGGGNQKQLTEDWDQSRAKLGGMFDAAMQSGGWQGFEDFKKVAKAGGSWNMVTEQPQAMSAPVPPASLARPVEVHDSSTHNVTVNLPPTANAQTAHKTAAAVARENRNSNQAARFGLEHAVEG